MSETKERLQDIVYSLRENGQTALGPALLLGVELASQGRPGSKVILCTDGVANIGLGTLEELPEEFHEQGKGFYTSIGQLAADKGVSVSVVAIEGQECRLDFLSPVVDQTSGDLTKVDPERIIEHFASVLQTETLATQVSVHIFLHKLLKFRNETEVQAGGSVLVKQVGNATAETEITFEFAQSSTVAWGNYMKSSPACTLNQQVGYYRAVKQLNAPLQEAIFEEQQQGRYLSEEESEEQPGVPHWGGGGGPSRGQTEGAPMNLSQPTRGANILSSQRNVAGSVMDQRSMRSDNITMAISKANKKSEKLERKSGKK